MESHDACIKMNAKSARKVFSSAISLQTYIHVSLLGPPRVFWGRAGKKRVQRSKGNGGGEEGGQTEEEEDEEEEEEFPYLNCQTRRERERGKKDEGGWVHLSSSGWTKICVQQQPQVTQFQ